MSANPRFKVAILGSGPAALMAATMLSEDARFEIHLFEKRKGFARKLLIAGSSGLNISHYFDEKLFVQHYSGWNESFWKNLFSDFSVKNWISFVEQELGLETFLGTSDRYFVREMKASGLLKVWLSLLGKRGVHLQNDREWIGIEKVLREATEKSESLFKLRFAQGESTEDFDFCIFALGGASWLKEEGLVPNWAQHFNQMGVEVVPFTASNVGYEVVWSEGFLKEAEGLPLKKINLTTARGLKGGELVVTAYGLEGTPIYFLGTPGPAYIDLKPDLEFSQMFERCQGVKENLSPIRRVKKTLGLGDAALALLFHQTEEPIRADLTELLKTIKKFPLHLNAPRSLAESISSKGGVALSEVSEALELNRYPGLWVAGEMLDWDAPTGGFLIQASISQGARVARAVRDRATRKMR